MTTETPPNLCPTCGAENDRATAMGGEDGDRATPEPGDLTVCRYCGAFAVFIDTEGRNRAATTDELREMQREHPDLWKMAERFSRMVRMKLT